MKRAPQIIALLLFTGCATQVPTKLISRETNVCIFLDNDDVLDTLGVAIQPVSARIEKYLVKDLSRRRINAKPASLFESGDAKLIVNINTIETRVTTKLGMWATVVDREPKIKYTATLLSGDGTTLFSINGTDYDESLDDVTGKIGRHIGEWVADSYGKHVGKETRQDYESKTYYENKTSASPSVTTGRLYKLDDGSIITVEFEQNETGHGFITGTSTSGETFKGEYNTLANVSAVDPKAYSWTAEMGFPIDSPNLRYGIATAAGNNGTTIEAIYTVNPLTGHGSGVGKDSKGIKYRLQF